VNYNNIVKEFTKLMKNRIEKQKYSRQA